MNTVADTATAPAAPVAPPNPFVGPQPLDEGQPLHGRRRETEELSNLIVAKRIVLLFSPSGAGKTSLIRAGLLRKLHGAYDMQALPIIRLGYRDPDCIRDASVNRYKLAMLVALESRRPEAQRRSTRELCDYSLKRYFEECVFDSLECDAEGQPKYPLLIFDQFEELFVDPLDVPCKREFLAELGDLLRGDPDGKQGTENGASIWALFAIREDRAAELQPYLEFIPTALAFRYRLDAMGVDAGREVIRETAKTSPTGESWVEGEVPAVLVNDLSTVSVLGEDGKETLEPGPALEPVHLQIVCRGLWDKVVAAQGRAITVGDVTAHGRSEVNRALADFYDMEVAKAVNGTEVSERALRDWIEHELISSSGVRTQCLYEPAMFGEDNCAIRRLVDAHVLRLEKRAGRDWIELPHDRLVGPIREANGAWSAKHLKPFQVRARQWHTATGEYTRLLLLSEQELKEANAYALEHPKSIAETELEFLKASEAEVVSDKKERRSRRLVMGAWVGSGIVVLGLALAWGVNERIERNRERADRELAELRSRVYRVNSGARERSSPGAALTSLLQLREEVGAASGGEPLLRNIDNAIRQQLTRSPAALVRELQPRRHIVWSLAFSGDGDRLFAGSWDGHISGQDLADPKATPFETPDLQASTYALVVHDATRLVASTHSDGRVLLWRSNGKDLQRIGVLVPPRKDPERLPAAAISDDGRWLVVGGWDRKVDVWDVGDPQSPRNVASFRNGGTVIQSLVFVPGKDAAGRQRLATTDYDGNVRVWSIGAGMPPTPAPVRTFAIRDHLGTNIGISASAVSPSGRWFVAGDTDGFLHLWDLTDEGADAKGIRLARATHRGSAQDTHVKGIAFARDSRSFVSVGLDGYLIRWTFPEEHRNLAELKAGTSAQRFKFPERLFSVAVRPRSTHQVAIGGTRSIYLLDLERGPGPALSTPLPTSAGLRAWRMVSVDAAGTRIAARGIVGPIRMWEHDAGRIRARPEWTLDSAGVSNFALSPDGQYLVTVDCHGTPAEWLLRAGSAGQRATPGEPAPTDCDKKPTAILAFSPDGRWLATSDTHVLRVFARRGQGARPVVASRALQRPDGADGGTRVGDLISAIAFSADSQRLAVGTASGATHLWDMAQATRRGVFAPVASADNGMAVRALAFHPDGKSLRAGGDDGFISRYTVPGFEKNETESRHERAIAGIQYARISPGETKWISADVDGYLLEWMRRPSMANAAASGKGRPAEERIAAGELARRGGAPIQKIALSRDGRFLVTAGEDLLAWDLAGDDVLTIARSFAKRGYTPPEEAPTR